MQGSLFIYDVLKIPQITSYAFHRVHHHICHKFSSKTHAASRSNNVVISTTFGQILTQLLGEKLLHSHLDIISLGSGKMLINMPVFHPFRYVHHTNLFLITVS